MAQDHDDSSRPDSIRAGPARPSSRRGAVDATARARIGRELRRHYAQVLSLPIPDHLRTLVDTLAESGSPERAERELPR